MTTIIHFILKCRSILLIASLFSIQLIAQTTYYVSSSGYDSNDGSEVSPWLTIQGAINNSSVINGDIIIVKDGSYSENINVTKEITIQSENGYENTTIIAVNPGDHVFEVIASNVTIEGFTIYGATNSNKAAIITSSVTNCTILNNRCGYDGTHTSFAGIWISNSANCNISDNICMYNSEYGINLGASNCTITNNTCSYSTYGFVNGGTDNVYRENEFELNGQFGLYIYSGTVNLGNDDINDKGNNTFRNNPNRDVWNNTYYPVNAYYNYWGSNDSATIDSHIYDNEEGRGEVYFDPFNPKVGNTFYVSPSGNDANDGSEGSPWLTIQGAINNSSVANGDSIIVKDGTYNENVNVTKEITLRSENGYLSTTVVAVYTGEDYVFEVIADNVTIEGFTTYGATAIWNSSGIGLRGANYCTINNNRCGLDATHQNWLAIIIRGNSSNNTISNNILSYNRCYGINIREGSNDNLIINNDISNNGGGGYGGYGIQNCENSTSNIVRGNNIESNETYGIRIITPGINLGNNDVNDKGNNTFRLNGGYDVYNATATATNAYYNYWGTIDATTIDSHIYDNEEGTAEVYFDPWLNDPMPVELTTFTASVKNNSVLLNWQTATEINNYGFEIQKSEVSSQNSEFETVGFVDGHGNSNSPKEYSFKDENITAGTYKYRLRQIDNDGQFKYSKVVEIERECK